MQLTSRYSRVRVSTGPRLKTLKENTIPLTEKERDKVMQAGATWNFGKQGQPSPAIKKAKLKDQIFFFSNTHRTFAVNKSLDAAINAFFDNVQPSS